MVPSLRVVCESGNAIDAKILDPVTGDPHPISNHVAGLRIDIQANAPARVTLDLILPAIDVTAAISDTTLAALARQVADPNEEKSNAAVSILRTLAPSTPTPETKHRHLRSV